jgi:hypothetical protein
MKNISYSEIKIALIFFGAVLFISGLINIRKKTARIMSSSVEYKGKDAINIGKMRLIVGISLLSVYILLLFL